MRTALICPLLAAVLALAQATPVRGLEVTYTLGKGSTFFDAPFNIEVSISGTFTLSKVADGPLGATYQVSAVQFQDSGGDRGLHISGSGGYRLTGEIALTSSMHLDLTVANGKVGRPVVLESPSAVVAVAPPDLDLSLDEVALPPPGSASRLHLIATAGETPEEGPKLRRGDANDDGAADLSDAVFALGWMFGEATPTCQDAVDVNDDGRIDLSDAVAILSWLYLNGDPPPAPGPRDCGLDTTPSPDITAPCVSKACN